MIQKPTNLNRNPTSIYYKILIGNAAISAIRLQQRMTGFSLTTEYFGKLLLEDSFSYLWYSIIFLYPQPIALALLPVFLFSLLHFASYSLNLLDVIGQNSWWGARLLISLVEFQSVNILRLISFSEIFLMPLIIIMFVLGRAGIFTPFMYYHFLKTRYASRRNPYTRNMFRELRQVSEKIANSHKTPSIVKTVILTGINYTCRLAPAIPEN